jgi:hypothetical protein
MSMTQLLFSFEGRLNRKPWWLTNIAVGVGVTVLLLLALAMVGERKFTEAFLTMALLIILYIPLLWVSLALGAKRLHDRDKSAWWLALIYLGPGNCERDRRPDGHHGFCPAPRRLCHHGLGFCRARMPARHGGAEPVRSRPVGARRPRPGRRSRACTLTRACRAR